MTLTKDTPVRTRDGREAEILATDMGGDHPVLARHRSKCGTRWIADEHTAEGYKYKFNSSTPCPLDLIPIRPERVVWINEYEHVLILHDTLSEAQRMGKFDRIALHGPITLSEDTIYRGDDE